MTLIPVLPSFHDGLLTGIFLADKKATLQLQKVDGTAYSLHLSGVEALQADDLRQGNIVSKLTVLSGEKPDDLYLHRCLERLFPPPHEKAESKYHEAYRQFVSGWVQRVIDGEAVLVALDSSYGADLVAVCTSITLSTGGQHQI